MTFHACCIHMALSVTIVVWKNCGGSAISNVVNRTDCSCCCCLICVDFLVNGLYLGVANDPEDVLCSECKQIIGVPVKGDGG